MSREGTCLDTHSNVGKTEMTINIRDGRMWNLVILRLLGDNEHLYRYKIGKREHKERKERVTGDWSVGILDLKVAE